MQMSCSVKGKIIVLSVLAVALCMLFTVSGSAAERSGIEEDEYDFTLVNTSGSTFNSVWLSHAGKLNWTDSDKLKMSKSLKNGESMQVKLSRSKSVSYMSARKERYCDIRVGLTNGKFEQWRKIDFKDVYKIEITKKDGKFHLIRFIP